MMRYIKCIPLFFLMFIAGCGGRKQIKKRVKKQVVQPKKIVQKTKKPAPTKKPIQKATQEPEKKLPVKNYKRQYTIIIEGMTCPVCEKSALYRLRKINGIEAVAVQGHNEASEEHTLLVTWKSKENLPLGAIVDAVEKEDFILHQLTGKLRGQFTQDNGKKFIVEGTGEPFMLIRAVGNSRPIHPQIWERVQKDKLFWVNLTIWRDPEDGVYKIALNRAHR